MCLGDSLCYLEQSAIIDYLNRADVRELLGAETPNNFTGCSREVGRNFNAHMDKWAVPSQYYVSGLLERGVPILIYAGTYDWQCNWVANKLWVDKLEWTGQEVYSAAEWRDWLVEGNKAGETKKSGVLTFATIRGAGHMGAIYPDAFRGGVVADHSYPPVPHDKPAESFAMVSRWLAGDAL